MLQGLFEGYPDWLKGTIVAVLVLALAYLVAELVSRVIASTIGRVTRHVPGDAAQLRATRAGLRAVRLVLALLVGLVLVFPAMALVGLRAPVGLTPERLGEWAAGSGLRIALVVLISWLLTHVVSLLVARMEAEIGTANTVDVLERTKRARTLGTLIQNTVYTLVSTIALLIVLRELSVDITPILTGAGIVGLAVGFGAQSLVKDVISGFFVILEDQVRVGDTANIDGTSGLVERITLRTIILRDEAGTVHVIPNGSIQRLSNHTKDFSYYVTSLAVSYREDTDRITRLLADVADGMQHDTAFAPFMLGPADVLGVDRFAESTLDVKVRIKTVPSKQFVVGREFLRRVKKALEHEGIELPPPQRRVLPSPPPDASHDLDDATEATDAPDA